MTARSWLVLAVAGLCCRLASQPSAASAEAQNELDPAPARWAIGLSAESLFRNDRGFALFDRDRLGSRLGLWASYDVAQFESGAALWLELGLGAERMQRASWGGALESQLESQSGFAGIGLRFALGPWLSPQLRASGGASRWQFRLSTDDRQHFEDEAISLGATLGAGFLLHTPDRLFQSKQGNFATFGAGLSFEAGYALREPIELGLKRTRAPHAIAVTQASLGELTLSGFYLRTSLVVRF